MCSDDTIYWIFCALVTQETTIITKQEHHLKEYAHQWILCDNKLHLAIFHLLWTKNCSIVLATSLFFPQFGNNRKKDSNTYIVLTHCFGFDISTYLKQASRYNDHGLAPWTSKPTIYKKYLFLFLMDKKPHTAVQLTYVPRTLYGFWKLI